MTRILLEMSRFIAAKELSAASFQLHIITASLRATCPCEYARYKSSLWPRQNNHTRSLSTADKAYQLDHSICFQLGLAKCCARDNPAIHFSNHCRLINLQHFEQFTERSRKLVAKITNLTINFQSFVHLPPRKSIKFNSFNRISVMTLAW